MIRKIVYTINSDGITPATSQFGGIQGEHKATNLRFIISTELYDSLQKLKSEKGGELFYRIDRYNGEGVVWSTEPFNLSNQDIYYDVEEWVTRQGGTVRIILAVTLQTDNNTEMELYTFPAVLKLKDKPTAETTEGENYESITGLAENTEKNAEIAENAAEIATEAAERTEVARAALESGAEWIFDGGTPSDSVAIDFVVDTEISDYSTNPVQNKVVKKYVDNVVKDFEERTQVAETKAENAISQINSLEGDIANKFNEQENTNATLSGNISTLQSHAYIAERVILDDGKEEYIKWSNGLAEWWKITEKRLNFTSTDWATSGIYLATEKIVEEYPTGLFISPPNCQYSIESGDQTSLFPICCGVLGTKTTTPNVRAARGGSPLSDKTVNIHWRAIGRWK